MPDIRVGTNSDIRVRTNSENLIKVRVGSDNARVRTNSDNLIKVRLGADNANRVVSAVANLNMSLSDSNDINAPLGIPNNSVLVYNSSTEQWDPYIFIDGGTY